MGGGKETTNKRTRKHQMLLSLPFMTTTLQSSKLLLRYYLGLCGGAGSALSFKAMEEVGKERCYTPNCLVNESAQWLRDASSHPEGQLLSTLPGVQWRTEQESIEATLTEGYNRQRF